MKNKKDNPSENALRRYLEETAKFDASRDPNDEPTEADWKYFKKVFPELQNRFLETKNNEIIQILTDSEKTPIERFRKSREVSDSIDGELRRCDRYPPRSLLFSTTITMLNNGMMTKADLLGFSLKFQKQMNSCLEKINR
mgnify:FL=1